MTKILFVCYGNVGRSQMAEAFYNKYTKSHNATSAGVGYNIGEKYSHPVSDIVKVMSEENIDISKNAVKALTKHMVDEAEKIIVMCDLDDCPRFLLDSGKIKHIPIPDPYGIHIDYVRGVRDEIKNMVLDIIDSE
jgi:arsenate reductase (thioredoxin)